MTLFNKRLLFLSIKIIGVLLILGLIALFLYYQFYFKKDQLVKYVPEDAVFYATVRLDEGMMANELIGDQISAVGFQISDFEKLNSFVRYNTGVAVVPRLEGEELNYDYLMLFDLKNDLITDITKKLEENHLKYYLIANNNLNQYILAVSDSEQTIEQVKLIHTQQAQSLGDIVSVSLGLEKVKFGNVGKIYFSPEQLLGYYNRIENPGLKAILLGFRNKDVKDLYLGLDYHDNKLVIKNQGFKSNTNQYAGSQVLQDWQGFLFLDEIKPQYDAWKDLLNDYEAEFVQEFDFTIEKYENWYNFDFEQDILSLSANNYDTISLFPENKYIISVELPENQDNGAKISKLEQIIIEHLAFSNPIEKQVQLEDGSYITEIVKNKENLTWNEENIADISLKSIKLSKMEYAYYLNKYNKLYFANSRQYLVDSINSANNSDLAEQSQCFSEIKTNLRQKMICKGNYLSQFIPFLSNFQYIALAEGNNDDDFWLCLEEK